MKREPDPYVAIFPKGALVRIADRNYLEQFAQTWRYHHPLQAEQLKFANVVTTIESIGFYHGGDQLYKLTGVPGIWHPECLRAEEGPA